MDGLSAATTVISVLQTAWQVISYVKAVKGAGEERRRLLVELVRARSLLATLNDVAEDVMDDEWSQALQNLDGPNGPLFAFKFFLEDIIGEMGIKTAPHQASQTQSMVTKLRRSKIMSCFHGSSSASSSPMTPSKRSEVIEHLPYNHRRTVAAKLDVVMKDLKWPFSQPRLQELLNTLERIKMHFLVALSSDNVRLSKLIRDELQTVHGGILVVSNNVTAIREHQDGSKEWTAEQKLIFQSISTLDFSSRIPPERLEGIKRNADWCLRHVQFRQWLTDGGALLLSGRPGTGKTSICAVVENFLKASGPSSDIFVVALYFSFKDKPENQSLQAVLAFIVEHMLKSRPQLQKHYNKLMLTGEGPLEVVDSLRILHRARQDFQHFYIVLDALDECDQQQAQEVVQKLTILRSPLRIFATARPIFFVHQFSHVFSYEITMSDDMVSHSIEAYIREALVKGPRFPITEALKEQAVHSIIAQSDGVYVTQSTTIKFAITFSILPQISSRETASRPSMQSYDQKTISAYLRAVAFKLKRYICRVPPTANRARGT